MAKTLLLVALGGGLGSVLRYLSYLLVQRFYTATFPLATFLVNIVGCLLIGIFVGWLDKSHSADASLKYLLITGFCGGFTTFSAFGLENTTLLQSGFSLTAFGYIASSVVIGLGAVWLGLQLSR